MNNKKIKEVLDRKLGEIQIDKDTVVYLKKLTADFVDTLNKELSKIKGNAEVFIGGSYAKGTLVKKYDYDIDVFVRFDWRFDNISDLLEKPLKKACKKLKMDLERLHGSRDYFRARVRNEGHYFEVIPVTRIKKPHEERNVTDLSYFHVPYVRRKIKGFENDLILAKTFFHAQKVYGAETYVRGFSGYALECLIIHYKGFVKMLKELSKVKKGERVIIDIEKKFKKKNDIFFELNENKLKSPVILIDPTYKERNALASLSRETFEKFQDSAKKFLKNPSMSFFEEKKIDSQALEKKAKKSRKEFLHLKLKTDKQSGDIAGTKLKKFSEFLEKTLEKYFEVKQREFEYLDNQEGNVYFILKSKKEIVRIGPPLRMKKQVRAFKKEHAKTYEKNGYVHSKLKINFTAKSYINVWKKPKSNKKLMKEMSITEMKIN